MKKLLALAFLASLTACVHNHVAADRSSSTSVGRPLRSLLVYVECTDADFGRRIEGVVAQELRGAVTKTELGSAHLRPDAAIDAVFSKAEALGLEGALIVAVEGGGVEVDRNPMPGYVNGAPVYKPKSTSQLVGRNSARLFDLRAKGAHKKIWQARAESNAGPLFGLRSTGDVGEDAVRDIISELRHDDVIAPGDE